MFAVLKTGGKQYRVQQGDVLRVEKLQADAGETIQFNEVLVVGDQIGAPFVAGAAVQATVIDQIKGEKVIHFVRRRRKHSSKRTKGHRQQLTLVRVTDILASGADSTGVKAAIGRGTRTGSAVPAAATSVAALASAAPAAAETAVATVRKRARKAADAIGDTVENVVDRIEDVAETVVDRVTDVVEDVSESRAAKVGLAAAAVAGVAAVAAAAVLSATSAAADDSADDKAKE